MNYLPFSEFMEQIELSMPLMELASILNAPSYHCVSIKNEQSNYLYANDNFLHLMGLQHMKQLRQLSDIELSQNKEDAKLYRDLDCRVLEEKKTIQVSETLMPKCNQPIIKTMTGALHPLAHKDRAPAFVLCIVTPQSQLLRLDWETVFKLTPAELRNLLVKRRYTIHLPFGPIILSKMEILTLVELLKGQQAREMAVSLCLKQTTVESYLSNIKNKCGVSNKSELLQLVISSNFLKQIIL